MRLARGAAPHPSTGNDAPTTTSHARGSDLNAPLARMLISRLVLLLQKMHLLSDRLVQAVQHFPPGSSACARIIVHAEVFMPRTSRRPVFVRRSNLGWVIQRGLGRF